jgi:hypothetical protein
VKIIITVETEDNKQDVLDLLKTAETDGTLDFVFNVQTKEHEHCDWCGGECTCN